MPEGVMGPLRPTQSCGRWAHPMPIPGPQVAIECLSGFAPDRQCPGSSALTQHPDDPLVQVHVIESHAGTLGPGHPGVHQEEEEEEEEDDDDGVTAAGKVPTLADPEQPSQMLGSNHVNRLLGQLRRPHVVHRAGLEVALGHRPLEEGVQASVAVVGGGRLPAGELVGGELLTVTRQRVAAAEAGTFYRP
jgi:hypothetical protein